DSAQALALCRRVETVFAEMLQPLQLSVTVAMDHGVAIFPPDAEQADQLIRIADERLYRLKHANHTKTTNGSMLNGVTPPAALPASPAPERSASVAQPISIETGRANEKVESSIAEPTSAPSATPSAEIISPPARVFAVQRKAERVSMTGTNAYAVLGDKAANAPPSLTLDLAAARMELIPPKDFLKILLQSFPFLILPPSASIL